jgi:hypothetical protein
MVHSAWPTYWDVGAQVSYAAFGTPYKAPWGSYWESSGTSGSVSGK